MIAQTSELRNAVTKSTGPLLAVEDLAQICNNVITKKRIEYLSRRGALLEMSGMKSFSLPIKVMLEAADLEKILCNCLDYSVKSLSGGQGLVRLNVVSGLRNVTITVEDNGFGMSEERLSLVDGAEKLSFAQMRGLVAFWGGRLTRNARLGVGSRVLIELPRVDAFVDEMPLQPRKALNPNLEMQHE